MRRLLATALTTALAVIAFPTAAQADHAWGSYHWARSSNPITLGLGDNVDSRWDAHLVGASADWTKSSVLDTVVVPGGTDPRRCRPADGRIEVCNDTYGNNGWLGLAQIWVSGSHITAANTKVNDTYFDTATYNTPEWRQFVMCQEIGHDFGLDHQDENFDNPNLGTCMDYTRDPSTNQHPNAHDYDMLEQIYSHLDSAAETTPGPRAGHSDTSWGEKVSGSRDAGHSVYVRDLGQGHKVITHVLWAR